MPYGGGDGGASSFKKNLAKSPFFRTRARHWETACPVKVHVPLVRWTDKHKKTRSRVLCTRLDTDEEQYIDFRRLVPMTDMEVLAWAAK